MMGMLNLVSEANDIHAKFASRFENNHVQNPAVLLARLKELRKRFDGLKAKYEEVQNTRDLVRETLMSLHVPSNVTERMPELEEQFSSVEKALEVSRKAAKAQNAGNVGKEAVKRALKVDREARLASAVNATTGGATKIQITSAMFRELDQSLQESTSIAELQACVDLLLHCGGRMPATSIKPTVLDALSDLEIITRKDGATDVQISRRFGVLFL